MLYIGFAIIVIGFAAYVRLAPSDPARWHKPLKFTTDRTFPGGVQKVVPGDLAAFAAIALANGDTQVLSGDVQSGRITFITRSAIMGFPDYTTVQSDGANLRIFGRLRFGRSDMGVNGRRVAGWVAAL